MFVSHKEFIKRTTLFLSLLKERKYVSARMLGECCQCSRETARQLINYLIDEYQVPLEYDQANHGYYLKDPSYSFSLPPVDQSELNVLILLQAIAKGLNAECLLTELELLWHKLAGERRRLKTEAELFSQRFTCDTTEASVVKESWLLQLVVAAKEGKCVRIYYRSPWKKDGLKEYLAKVDKVRLKDGALYLLVQTHDGKERVLNAAYIHNLEEENNPSEFLPLSENQDDRATNFENSFGIWAGGKVENVVITFASEVSRFYAAQQWHPDQRDEFDEEKLIRTLPSILSPELRRRLLSIAPHIISLEPQELSDTLVEAMELQIERLSKRGA